MIAPDAQPEPTVISFEGRLLAEAARAWEAARADAPLDDEAACASARERGGTFETRLVHRARTLTETPHLERAAHQMRRVVGVVIVLGVVLAALAGFAAARASLHEARPDTVNIFWALGGLLGIQTVMLLAWVLLLLIRPNALTGGSLGGVALGAARWLARRAMSDRVSLAAGSAVAAVHTRGAIGRWTVGSISHGFWVVFNITCLAFLVLLLSTRHYSFNWETTILSANEFTTLTNTLATVPGAVGFDAPTDAQIAASEGAAAAAQDEATRRAWSQFLLGGVVCYGLVPRVLLLIWSLVSASAARRRFRLDITHPQYQQLRPRLMPSVEAIGVVDPDTGGLDEEETTGHPAAPSRPAGPPAIVALEMTPPTTGWPPPGLTPLDDLGFVVDRVTRERVLTTLRESTTEPNPLVIVVALTTTPDRGLGRWLAVARDTVSRPPWLILTAGQALRRRCEPEAFAQRLADWHDIARMAHVPDEHVREIDLDHLTDESLQVFAAAAGMTLDGIGAGHAARTIETAFATIIEHAERWSTAPDEATQAELHRAIARLHRSESASWRDLLGLPGDLHGDWQRGLTAGAERVVELLPPVLRTRPRWLAIGAMTGALGCVAAATLVAPAAITTLPAWAGLGAALAAVVDATCAGIVGASTDGTKGDVDAAVRSAALFAMLLELQGRDESTISSVLARTLDVEGDARITDVTAARAWLDATRHRFDLAVAAEDGA